MKTMFRRSVFSRTMARVAILALGMAALGTLSAMAQDPAPAPQDQTGPPRGGRGGPRGEERQVEFLTRKLSLTPDQVAQVKAIDDDSRKQMMALRDDTTTAGPDRRAKMMEIRKTSSDKIRAVLTDDQKTKYDALMEQMKERREHGGGPGGQGGPGGPPPPPPPAAPQQ